MQKALTFRIDEQILERLREVAEYNQRSVNGQLEWMAREAIQEHENAQRNLLQLALAELEKSLNDEHVSVETIKRIDDVKATIHELVTRPNAFELSPFQRFEIHLEGEDDKRA